MTPRLASLAGNAWLVRRAVGWIERQRNVHRLYAAPISSEARDRLAPFFLSVTLEPVRVRPVTRVAPPKGLGWVGRLPPLALDFDRVYGITFVDTILVAEDRIPETARLATLFHECVHAAQYQLLGVDAFVRRYLAGWAEAGYRYEAIPLERQAYALQRRFTADPGAAFSVEAELTPA